MKYLLFIVYLTFFIKNAICEGVHVNSLTCIAGKRLCTSSICNIVKAANKADRLTIGCVLAEPLYKVMFDLKIQRKRGGQYVTLVQTKANMCDFTKSSLNSAILERLMKLTKQFVNYKCPIKGNMTAINVPVKINLVSGFMMASNYRMLINLQNAEERIMIIKFDFSIKQK